MAKKEKKITIKHYLNKKLKPLIHNGKNYYPVYLRLGYDRITTIVKSNYLVYSDDIFSKDIVENEKDHLYKIEYLTEEDFLKPEIQSLFEQEAEGLKIAITNIVAKGNNPIKSFKPDFFSIISEPIYKVFGTILKELISEELNKSDRLLNKFIDFKSISIKELKEVVDNYLTKEIRHKKIYTTPIVELYINIGLKLEHKKNFKVFIVFTPAVELFELSDNENEVFQEVVTDKIFSYVKVE